MGKIFYIMGKSASGKDTLYRRLLEEKELQLKPLIPYTTRPIRSGEAEGVEYHFTDLAGLQALEAKGKVVEQRCYHTVHGDWYYFTVDDGNLDLENDSYLGIGTLPAFEKMRNYFGEKAVIPIYVSVDDGVRLERALMRERTQKEPKYKEMCRRFLADEEDFDEEKRRKLGLNREYYNDDLEKCLKEIVIMIKQQS